MIKNKEADELFFYEVEHFYKDGGPSCNCHNAASQLMRREVESYFSNGQKFIKETDSDWELGQQWEQQYFYKNDRYIIMKSLNTETIKYFIGDKFYFFS